MQKSITAIIFFISFFSSQRIFSQVKSLPPVENVREVPGATIDKAFANLHQFSERIYRSKKITQISENGFKESEERWPAGSWGRGYFTWFVDIPVLYDQKNRKKHYLNWYENERQWSSHPLIRDTARRVVAYIHKYRGGDQKRVYIERIQAGLRYLVDQQKANTSGWDYGSFIQWTARPGKDQPNIDDTMLPNFGIQYSTGLAIRALVEGYFFCEDIGWPETLRREQVVETVKKAADWLMRISTDFDSGTYNVAPEKISLSPVNYRCLTLWGLTSAYRLLQDSRYLLRAFDVYQRNISGYQDENGAWYYNYGGLEPFHDTTPYYSGIVLRGLADLYDVLPPDFDRGRAGQKFNKASLKRQIVLTINHFLTPGMGVNPKTGKKDARLQRDGYILPYYKFYDYSPEKAVISPPNELLIGLHYAFNARDLLNEGDKKNVLNFMNAGIRSVEKEASGTITNSTDVYMNVLAHYSDITGFNFFRLLTK